MQLADRFVLLTGGSRGIGPVIAERLAREGAHVALTARSVESLKRVAASLRSFGVRVLDVPADLIHHEERERVAQVVLDEFGRIDVLINNAGIELVGRFSQMSWHALHQSIALNFHAPVHLTHRLLPCMLERGEGHVVCIASMSAKAGAPYEAIYSGTKGGIAQWGGALRRELAGTGVGVSTIFPGFVTELGVFARFGLQPPALMGSCTPRDVAEAVHDAIRHDRGAVIVNSLPLRPALAFAELFPPAGDWLMRRIGVDEVQRRKAEIAADQGFN